MVQTLHRWQESEIEETEPSVWFDPAVLMAARQIYTTHYEALGNRMREPIGVAIDRYTHRGKVIFKRPILLPQECFIPIEELA